MWLADGHALDPCLPVLGVSLARDLRARRLTRASPALREAGDAPVAALRRMICGSMIGLMMAMRCLTSSRGSRGASAGSSCDVDELRVGVLVGVLVQDAAGGLAQHGSAGEPG